jgi:hypothetical protein
VSSIKRWVLSERNTLYTIIKNYDDENLARILPAALLLMLQRTYLDVRPNSGALGIPQCGSTAATYWLRHYAGQVWSLLQKHAYRQLWRSVRDEIWWRTNPRRATAVRSNGLTVDGLCEIPTIALSRMMAGHDVQLAWPRLLETRKMVQELRVRSDAQIFPLFQWSLTSNFGDAPFIQAMQLVIARFGLVHVFEPDHPRLQLGSDLIDSSRAVSQMLLKVMTCILMISGVPEAQFRLGEAMPDEFSRVPTASVVALAEVNQLLWSLPDASLEEVLKRLSDGCQEILKSLGSVHG